MSFLGFPTHVKRQNGSQGLINVGSTGICETAYTSQHEVLLKMS